jgi:N-acetylglucosaminyldiphosphoundecaprenol N-acetyl-beta-D-mannosaminyltransferase
VATDISEENVQHLFDSARGNTSTLVPREVSSLGVSKMQAFALTALPSLRLSSGEYCFDQLFGSTQLRGSSLRYTAMVLLGLLKSSASGVKHGFDVEELESLLHDRVSELTLGDLGLLFWIASRTGRPIDSIADRLTTATDGELDALAGMEIAWILIGTANHFGTTSSPISREIAVRINSYLRNKRTGKSGLPLHVGTGFRSRFPNFATLIYTLMAYAAVARVELDPHAGSHAIELADKIIGHQLPDGGWPWLFDATSGRVVERYEVYSVHQDAMAPMGLFDVYELTRQPRFRDAAVRGLGWSLGTNELGVHFFDGEHGFAHRSIRRKKLTNRVLLSLNTASSSLIRRPVARVGRGVELNDTCRPYHLGWMLEAFAGREQYVDEVNKSLRQRAGESNLFGLRVDSLSMDQTIERVRQLVDTGGPHQHAVINASKVVESSTNAPLRDILNSCALINVDGQAVVWASKLLAQPLPERVAGIDLFERLVETAAKDGKSVYYLGAQANVVKDVARVHTNRYPGLKVAGFRDGFWKDDAEVIREVRTAAPDYLFLAIPSPRKEFWLNKNLESLAVPFVMGVGGSFDVVAGLVQRAPKIVQRIGLEWTWRLLQEPRRMFKRYAVGNTKFILLTLREWMK